jgi:hypothetical protein
MISAKKCLVMVCLLLGCTQMAGCEADRRRAAAYEAHVEIERQKMLARPCLDTVFDYIPNEPCPRPDQRAEIVVRHAWAGRDGFLICRCERGELKKDGGR